MNDGDEPTPGDKDGPPEVVRKRGKRRQRLTTADQEPSWFKGILELLYHQPFVDCDEIRRRIKAVRPLMSEAFLQEKVESMLQHLDRFAQDAQLEAHQPGRESIPEEKVLSELESTRASSEASENMKDADMFALHRKDGFEAPWKDAMDSLAKDDPSAQADPGLTSALQELALKVQWWVNTLHIVLKKRKGIDRGEQKEPRPGQVADLQGLLDKYLWLFYRQTIRVSDSLTLASQALELPFLHKEAEVGDLETIQQIWQAASGMAYVNYKDSQNRTALHLACAKGHTKIVELLVSKAEFDVSAKDKDGNTPPMLAAVNGRAEVLELLISKGWFGAVAEAVNEDGMTALMLATREGHLGVAEILVEKGQMDVNLTDDNWETALHAAASYGHADTCQFLLKAKAKVDPQNLFGHTPLHLAAFGGHLLVVTLLVEASANVNAQEFRSGVEMTEKPQTPTDLACREGHQDIVEYLTSKGAEDSNVKLEVSIVEVEPKASVSDPHPPSPPASLDKTHQGNLQPSESVDEALLSEELDVKIDDTKGEGVWIEGHHPERELYVIKHYSTEPSRFGFWVPVATTLHERIKRGFELKLPEACRIEPCPQGFISETSIETSKSTIAQCHEAIVSHSIKKENEIVPFCGQKDLGGPVPKVCAVLVDQGGQLDLSGAKSAVDFWEGRALLEGFASDDEEGEESEGEGSQSTGSHGRSCAKGIPAKAFQNQFGGGMQQLAYRTFLMVYELLWRCARFGTAFPEIALTLLAHAFGLAKAKVSVEKRCYQLRGRRAVELLATLDTYSRDPDLDAAELKARASAWLTREQLARLVYHAFGPVLLLIFNDWLPPDAFLFSNTNASNASMKVNLEDCAVLGEVLFGAFFGSTKKGSFGCFASCWLFLQWLQVMEANVTGASSTEAVSETLPASLGHRLALGEVLQPSVGALLSKPSNSTAEQTAGHDLMQEVTIQVPGMEGPEQALRVRFYTTDGALYFVFVRANGRRRGPMESVDKANPAELKFFDLEWDDANRNYVSQLIKPKQSVHISPMQKPLLPRKVLAWLQSRPIADIADIRHFQHDVANQKDRRQGEERYHNPDEDTTLQEKRTGEIEVGFPVKPSLPDRQDPSRPQTTMKFLVYQRDENGNLGEEGMADNPQGTKRSLMYNSKHKAMFSPRMQTAIPNKVMEALCHNKSISLTATPKKKLKGAGAEYTERHSRILSQEERDENAQSQGTVVSVEWAGEGDCPTRIAHYYVFEQMKDPDRPPRAGWLFMEKVEGAEEEVELIYVDKLKHFISPYMTTAIRAVRSRDDDAARTGIPIPPQAMELLMDFMFKSVRNYTELCKVFRRDYQKQPWLPVPHYVKALLGYLASSNLSFDPYTMYKSNCLGYIFVNPLLHFQMLIPGESESRLPAFELLPDNRVLVVIGSIVFRTMVTAFITEKPFTEKSLTEESSTEKSLWQELTRDYVTLGQDAFVRFAARLMEAVEEPGNLDVERIATMERFIEICVNPLTCCAIALEAGLHKSLICDRGNSKMWKQTDDLQTTLKSSSDATKWDSMLRAKIPMELGDLFLATIGAILLDSDFATVAALLLPDCYEAAAALNAVVPPQKTSISGVLRNLLGGGMHRSALQFKQPGARDEYACLKKRVKDMLRVEIRPADATSTFASDPDMQWLAQEEASKFQDEVPPERKVWKRLWIGEARQDSEMIPISPPLSGPCEYIATQRCAAMMRDPLDKFLKALKERKSETLRDVSKRSQPAQKGLKILSSQEPEFYCSICEVLFNGQQQKESHMQGKKHLKRKAEREADRAAQPEAETKRQAEGHPFLPPADGATQEEVYQ
mmetsp:Transcript_18137/g.38767  ORF Transcript_18137/g.38767 Transcript_18137/m.38767 type:complete len:1823 (+) Transcript_18137:121-5589(+)